MTSGARYWASYLLTKSGASWADSTKARYLRALEHFYLFVEARPALTPSTSSF